MVPFESLDTVSYSQSIVTMAPSLSTVIQAVISNPDFKVSL